MASLTFAPLPSWENAFKAVLGINVPDKELAAPWLQGNEEGYWLSRSAWSLYLIAKFRMLVMGKDSVTVWFPDYFCNSSIAPLRSLDITLKFFPILKDGNPDLSACEKLLNEGNPDLIVAVHYFGKPALVKELSDFSTMNKAWLIEDGAHVLQRVDGVGNYGDFILYSPHKFLPIPEGGLLILRDSGPGKITKTILEQFDFNSIHSSIINDGAPFKKLTLKWLAKRLLQRAGVRGKPSEVAFQGDEAVMDVGDSPHPRMSQLSKNLLQLILPNLEKESRIRKANQEQWDFRLSNTEINKAAFFPLTGSYTPYLAAFLCENSQMAENTFVSLQDKKIPVSTWPDLPPEVLLERKKHSVAIELRQTRFFLPVHSSLSLD
jgi:dTDP-4-amino-4,6-dideoxygalactose transaminase